MLERKGTTHVLAAHDQHWRFDFVRMCDGASFGDGRLLLRCVLREVGGHVYVVTEHEGLEVAGFEFVGFGEHLRWG